MSNPFIEPRSLLVEQERRRRERFKFGVYAVLGVLVLLLCGLLIQGCQQSQQAKHETADATASESATNTSPPAAPTNPTPAQAAAPETNPPAPPIAAATASAPNPAPAAGAAQDAPIPPAGAIPATALPDKPAETSYTIKPGDTLLKIAKAHRTTVRTLKQINGLKSDRIVAGKALKLPTPAPAEPAHS